MKRKKTGFGNYLREMRSLRDLSAKTKISLTRLWAYEHGRSSPTLDSLALSRAFNQPLYRFLRPLR